jgi:hypothetical protein
MSNLNHRFEDLPESVRGLVPPMDQQAFESYQISNFSQVEGKIYQIVESELNADPDYQELSEYEKLEKFNSFLEFWEHHRKFFMIVHKTTLYEQCHLRAKLSAFTSVVVKDMNIALDINKSLHRMMGLGFVLLITYVSIKLVIFVGSRL